MSQPANRIFISYRREDAAGYAGRLEASLEQLMGRGSVFRDVLDISPGEDFVDAIRGRLAGATAVLILIGPRWAGEGPAGQRRIDEAGDFVRLEVATALEGPARVVPVLLPGAVMPGEQDLPAPLRSLATRNALSLSDVHWEADVGRLAEALGVGRRRSVWAWVAGAAAVAGAALAGLAWMAAAVPPTPAPDPLDEWVGHWTAPVSYPWGDHYNEHFDFKRHAGQLAGTASFLAYPRAIEAPQVAGRNLQFITHSRQSMGNETREVTHHYSVELRGTPPAQTLEVRYHTTGAFDEQPPLEFHARRVPGPAEAPRDPNAPQDARAARDLPDRAASQP